MDVSAKNEKGKIHSRWPVGWDAWLADDAWRQSLARAIEERDELALARLCECWIGLECHARLDTGRKLFCALPEGQAGWVDIGLPGALPTLDPMAPKRASELGVALGATLSERFGFERKRYAYPDLSKGYQTTQKAMCVWFGGQIRWEGGSLALDRAQIEEDAAKVKRDGQGFEMDFRRAGSPLLEIVSVAAPMWPDEAARALKALWREGVHSGATQGRIEEGHFKSDINISMRPRSAQGLGERVEVKGVGSFDFARLAAVDVMWMLAGELLGGAPCPKRTYGFDEVSMACEPMREKSGDAEYKFLPDGDLALRPRMELSRARMGWFDALEVLREAFGRDPQTEALWEDPRKSRVAIEVGSAALASAKSIGAEQAGALARAFFAKADKARADAEPILAAAALAWACQACASGVKRSSVVAAATQKWGASFDAAKAVLALGSGDVLSLDMAATELGELLAADPKARAAMEQACSGKPKAIGYVFGVLAARLSHAQERLDKEGLSAWLSEYVALQAARREP